MIAKVGSLYDVPFTLLQGNEHIWLDSLQSGQRQGRLNLGCRLRSLQWNIAQNKISLHISHADNESESESTAAAVELLSALFAEPIVLDAGVGDEIHRYNRWQEQVNEDVIFFEQTKRNAP